MYNFKTFAELIQAVENMEKDAVGRKIGAKGGDKRDLAGQVFALGNVLEMLGDYAEGQKTVEERNTELGLPTMRTRLSPRFKLTARFTGQPDSGILGSGLEKIYIEQTDAEKCFDLFAGDSNCLSVELHEERLLKHT